MYNASSQASDLPWNIIKSKLMIEWVMVWRKGRFGKQNIKTQGKSHLYTLLGHHWDSNWGQETKCLLVKIGKSIMEDPYLSTSK